MEWFVQMYFGSLWIIVQIPLTHIITFKMCSLFACDLPTSKKTSEPHIACAALVWITNGTRFGLLCPSQWHLCAGFQRSRSSVRQLSFNPHSALSPGPTHSHLHWPGSEVVFDKRHLIGWQCIRIIVPQVELPNMVQGPFRREGYEGPGEFTCIDTNAYIKFRAHLSNSSQN